MEGTLLQGDGVGEAMPRHSVLLAMAPVLPPRWSRRRRAVGSGLTPKPPCSFIEGLRLLCIRISHVFFRGFCNV